MFVQTNFNHHLSLFSSSPLNLSTYSDLGIHYNPLLGHGPCTNCNQACIVFSGLSPYNQTGQIKPHSPMEMLTMHTLLHMRHAGFLIVNDLLLEAGGIKIDAKICCLLDFYVNSGANMQNTRGDVVVKWKV